MEGFPSSQLDYRKFWLADSHNNEMSPLRPGPYSKQNKDQQAGTPVDMTRRSSQKAAGLRIKL